MANREGMIRGGWQSNFTRLIFEPGGISIFMHYNDILLHFNVVAFHTSAMPFVAFNA